MKEKTRVVGKKRERERNRVTGETKKTVKECGRARSKMKSRRDRGEIYKRCKGSER